MAVTKIWTIKDSLQRVLDYAANPDKTEYDALAQTLHYAENDTKTNIKATYLYIRIYCVLLPQMTLIAILSNSVLIIMLLILMEIQQKSPHMTYAT